MLPRIIRCLFLLVVAASVLPGCARTTVTTEIQPDGTWVRTVAVHVPKDTGGKSGAKKLSNVESALKNPFLIPKGPDWTVTRSGDKDEVVFTAIRTFKLEEVSRQDVALRKEASLVGMMESFATDALSSASQASSHSAKPASGERRRRARTHAAQAAGKAPAHPQKSASSGAKAASPPKPVQLMLSNEVTVHQIAPGRFEYREVIKWEGERPKEALEVDPETLSVIKAALPPPLSTDDTVRQVAHITALEQWRMFFGPAGDPLLTQLPLQPDLVEQKMKRQLSRALDRRLQEKFGDSLGVDARHAVVRKIVARMVSASPTAKNVKEKVSSSSLDAIGDLSLTTLSFSTRFPGRILSTNGEVDDVNGEVYWSMYAMAPAAEDVVLTVVCDVNQP